MEDRLESKKSIRVKLSAAFEIENSAMHYVDELGSHQQTTAEKRAAHLSVVEMTMHIWQSDASRRSSLATQTTEATGR